jgi:Xaa-Pro dipeptidase
MEANNENGINNSVELEGLPNSFFEINRNNFYNNLTYMLSGLELDSILILQGGEDIPLYDTDINAFYFCQESNFYYLTGVREPLFYAIFDIQRKGHLTLYYNLKDDEKTKTYYKVPTIQDLIDKYGSETVDVQDFKDFYTKIQERNPKKIYVLNGVNTDSKRQIKPADLNFPKGIDFLDRVDTNPYVYEILAETRTKKTPEEIALITFLCKATVQGHIEAIKSLKDTHKPHNYERDLENTFFNYTRKNFFIRHHAYPMICGCGHNSATLHYIDNTQKLSNLQDLILLDMGIRMAGYCSDITSTVPVGGQYTNEQKIIYNIVLAANRNVMKQLKPGVYWPDMHKLAESTILQGLIQNGILKLKDEETIENLLEKRVAYYFMPHGLGHLLGLEVHDVGGYLSFTPPRIQQKGLSSLRTARVLEAGNVLTVEPGIYFIPFLLEKAYADDTIKDYFQQDVIKKFMNDGKVSGIRIEDDVLITNLGCKNLTEDLPRTPEEIERLMKSV